MTTEQLIKRLKSDPRYLIEAVAFNNPIAVRAKLSEFTDQEYDSVDDIINAIYAILEEGEVERVDEIMQVPFLDENAKPVLIDTYESLAATRNAGQGQAMLDSSRGLYYLVKEHNSKVIVPATRQAATKKLSIRGCYNNPNSWCNKRLVGVKVKYIIGGLIVLLIVRYFIKTNTKIKIDV